VPLGSLMPGDLERFAERVGAARAKKMFSVLGKNQQFANAVASPIGQELLTDALELAESLLEKIVLMKASDEDLAEYRVLMKLLTNWQQKITKYLKGVETIVKVSRGGK